MTRCESDHILYTDGTELYGTNDHFHRSDGPAYIFMNNRARCETWYINGIKHREDGPAVTWFRNDAVRKCEWWYNGNPETYTAGSLRVNQWWYNRLNVLTHYLPIYSFDYKHRWFQTRPLIHIIKNFT